MRLMLVAAVAALGLTTGVASAQVELKAYTDAKGFIDVEALTCAQLANTYQEDADYLSVWYSGWYNARAKKHDINIPRTRGIEHKLIIYCKEHQDQKITQALDILLNDQNPAAN